MRKYILTVGIATSILVLSVHKFTTQDKINYLSSSKFVIINNDVNNFKSLAALVINTTPSKVKNWSLNKSNNLKEFKDYLINFNVESEWDNYNILLRDIGQKQETCKAIPNMGYPIPIILKNDGKYLIAAITSNVDESFVVFIPKKGLYIYNCIALLNNWNHAYLGFYGIARSKIKLP